MNQYDNNISTYTIGANPLRVSSEFNDTIISVEIRNTGANPVYVNTENSSDVGSSVELLASAGALSVVKFHNGGQWVSSPLGSVVGVVTEFVNILAPSPTSNGNESTDPTSESSISDGHVNIMNSQYS